MLPTGNRSRHPCLHWQTRFVSKNDRPIQALSVRGLLAAVAMLLGGLHLMVADSRSADWLVEGLVLMGIAIASGIVAMALLVTPARWPMGVLGGLGLASVVGIIWTRLVGYPFGPFADYSPRLTFFDVLTILTALIAAALSVAALTVGVAHIGEPGARFDTMAPLLVVATALFGLGLSSWTEEAAYIAGASHSHGVPSGGADMEAQLAGANTVALLTASDRVRLGVQMDQTRAATAAWPTLSAARAAGWIPLGTFVPGTGQMLVDPTAASQDRVFDPGTPSALLFASSDDDAPVVGAQFDLWGDEAPDGFIGQRPLWHLHAGTCMIDDERGSFAVVYDPPITGTACQDIDGQLTNTFSWMIRAWVVPGWDNPAGPFAHDHSLLAQPQ